jgi:hypothetical protein
MKAEKPVWAPIDPAGRFNLTAAQVTALWPRLHQSDLEPLPADTDVLAAWVDFHRGDFQLAAEAGRAMGTAGATVANKAVCVYAQYVEPEEAVRQKLLWQAAQDAAHHVEVDPHNANAHFLHALALARYSQGIRVAQALAMGVGHSVQEALANALRLQPAHASAHIALGVFHADVIDKVGPLIGRMTYGVNRETSLRMLEDGVRLAPTSPIGLLEYAKALASLDGESSLEEAHHWCSQATTMQPFDAKEWLEVQRARTVLAAWPP